MKPLRKTAGIAGALGGFLVIGAAAVVACGPDFPLQLLDDRAGTLKNTPANSFAWEAAHLVTSSDQLRADEGRTYDGQREDDPNALRMRERGRLDDRQFARLKAMRAQPDGDAAYTAGDGLPAAIRLYTAAAQDYRADQLPRARSRFEAVLALPPQQAAERAVWAAYMLGRIHAANIGTAGAQAGVERRQAIARFEQTRKLALGGAPDPLGLAVDSFGEQARLYLTAQGRPCDWSDFEDDRECAAGVAAGDLRQAIRLYAEQAARGSVGAVASLRTIAYWALKDAGRSAPLVDDAIARQLLVAFALARMGDVVDSDDDQSGNHGNPDDSVYAYDPYDGRSGASGYPDAARGKPWVKPNPVLVNLVDALQRRGMAGVAGADRIAALAYRTGRYDLAGALAQQQDSVLAWWVRAKLALRAGDNAGAAQAYARAVQGFPNNDGSVELAGANRLMGEQGVLTLARGQYVEALEQLHQAARGAVGREGAFYYSASFISYVNDMAYVAERVLSTDELQRYVDAHAPASPMPSPQTVARLARQEGSTGRENYIAMRLSPVTIEDTLRQLLARRLVRDGKVEQALAYFPDDDDVRFVRSVYDDHGKETPVSWRIRAKAREYGQALERARHAWRASARAEGWYRAALIARRQGMEIMGYEQGPDFAAYGGNYPFGAGRRSSAEVEYEADGKRKTPLPATPQARAADELAGPFVTDEERRRYAASEARPYKRFHYRDLAADYALKAADELPPRSQAFAAVLCQGSSFVFYDAQRSGELYRRYVSQGAAVPFAADFGQQCVEPDFAAAARFPYVQAWRGARTWLGRHRVAAALLLAAALAAVAGIAVQRRRRRAQ